MFSINHQFFVVRSALILILILMIEIFGVVPARAVSVTHDVKWDAVSADNGKSGTDVYMSPWNSSVLPENWLERFNYYRGAAGLPLVVESSAYSADLAKHVNYMLLNVPTEGLWHGETMGRPGYTAEGAQAAAESNLYWFPSGAPHTTPAMTIDGWMASIHHRYGMLRPDLVTTGYGLGCDSQNCGSGLNVIRGIVWDSVLRPNGVVYPGPSQDNVNRDIIITWQFTGPSTVTLINASLKNPLGQSIAITKTVPPNGDYFNMISVDPVPLLAYGTTYTADITVQLGAAQIHQTWNFTTAIDKTAFPYTISGNAGVSGATITYTGGSTTADGSGNYSFPIPSGWSGTVTPSKCGYSFSPINQTYANVVSNQTAQNYATTPVAPDAETTGVFRPSNGLLYLKNCNSTGFADIAINYGLRGDYPVPGDWDGNGTTTIGIYRNGSFYLRNSNTLGFADLVFAFGIPGDQPIAGDWNNDGVDTIGVYRSSTGQFLLRNSNTSGPPEMSFYLGNVGDVGVAGDWNGDGMDTTGVFRPSNGMIFLKNANTTGFANISLNYGLPGDQPVTGDWNNDGTDTIGVYRNGQFLLRNSNTNGFADLMFGLGIPGDMPIAGNWDGR